MRESQSQCPCECARIPARPTMKTASDVALADGAIEKIADPESSLVVGRRVYYPTRGYGVVDKVDNSAANPFRVVFEDGGEPRQA